MTPSRLLRSSFSLVVLMFAISCVDADKEVEEISIYEWKESIFSSVGLFTAAQLEIGDDGMLYALGTPQDTWQRAIFKYAGNIYPGTQWANLGAVQAETYGYLESLAILNGSVYFHVFNKLYKVENDAVKEILSADAITGLEACQNKLIITGEGIKLSDDANTIVSYDGTTFIPLSRQMALSRVITANNKVYIPCYPGFSYDGQDLLALNYFGYFYAVDSEESIYFGDSFNYDFTMEKMLRNGEISKVGNTVQKFGLPQEAQFYDGTLVMTGFDEETQLSTTYYLHDDKWIQIQTEHVIYDIIVFKGKLLSSSLDGMIFELVRK